MSKVESEGAPVAGHRPTARAESQDLTRRRLLDAATGAFTVAGFHGVSVGAVAAAAGYSTGAVYSNFANKEELFLAVLDRKIERHVAELEAATTPATDTREALAAVAALFAARLDRELDWNLSLVEFVLHARRDPALAAKVALRHRRMRESFAAAIDSLVVLRRMELSAPTQVVADALLAVGTGLLVQEMLEPGSGAAEAYGRTLVALGASAGREP